MSYTTAGVTDAFIARLPKAELHVHLEGTLEPEMMLRLATRNGVRLPWSNVDELRAAYRFTGLEHFLVLLFHGAQTFLDAGVPIQDQLGGVLDAMHDAATEWDIAPGLIVTAQRHRTQRDALELFELVQPWAKDVLGFGLAAAERGNPPRKFAEYFALCRSRGFRTTIHAGEDAPAAYVREALDVCHPDRIDHGTTSATDPELVARLRDEAVTLTMCPLSNVALQVVPTLEQHPLAELLRAGVRVTVNSDDPAYFGGYVKENYLAVRDTLAVSRAELATLARNSFLGSFDTPERIVRALARVEAFISGEHH